MSDPLSHFIESVEAIVRSGGSQAEIVAKIEPRLLELVRRHGWLEARFRRPIPTKAYAQYLLHRPDDYSFSIVSFVWNGGEGSPLHDHGTWGVIGQYEGEEEEERFRRTAGGIERISIVKARPGDVSHVYPPERDIHRILNRTATPTVSIHVYGGDIGSQRRNVFDPVSGTPAEFVSGYDQPIAAPSEQPRFQQ